MTTNVFHITYCPEFEEAVVHYWGCNFYCKGCSCKKSIGDWNLSDVYVKIDQEPTGIAQSPKRFLEYDEVIEKLSSLKLKRVLHQGQEAQLDPFYSKITKAIHEKIGAKNVLFTNLHEMPPLEDTDVVEFGMKAYSSKIHRDYTGMSNRKALKNFKKVYESGVDVCVESIFIPGYIDVEETERMAKFIASVDKDIFYVILAYFKAGDNPWRRPTHDEIDRAVAAAKKHLNKVHGVHGDEEMLYPMVRIVSEHPNEEAK
jgi:pyruvate-formate lyase-activating enzyme